jgi:hypothetical protein
MSPLAKRVHPLLYSSDALTNEVYVYAVNGKNDTPLGELTGFDEPYGMCADKSGNVYITNMQGNDILEYAHGGTTAIKTLSDSYGNPGGCSVNPKTGDLAVTNFLGGGSGYGSLVIYSGGSGSGTLINIGTYQVVYAPVYDSKGNLFFETMNDSNQQATVYELPNGGSSVVPLALPSGITIHSPSGVTWDGKDVGITDEEYESGNDEGVYRLAVSGSSAKLVGQASYSDDCYYTFSIVVQPIVYKDRFIGGNFYCYYANNFRLDYWNYKTGGSPIRYINGAQSLDTSYGQAISK